MKENFLLRSVTQEVPSEPHLHIHHQRQDPSKVIIFLSEGLPLYFRTEKGVIMPEKGEYIKKTLGGNADVGEILYRN